MTRVQNSVCRWLCLISEEPSSAFSRITLKHSTYIFFILSCLFEGQMLQLGMDDRTELWLTSRSQFPLCNEKKKIDRKVCQSKYCHFNTTLSTIKVPRFHTCHKTAKHKILTPTPPAKQAVKRLIYNPPTATLPLWRSLQRFRSRTGLKT